jgi:hypothetical protein
MNPLDPHIMVYEMGNHWHWMLVNKGFVLAESPGNKYRTSLAAAAAAEKARDTMVLVGRDIRRLP